jgi:dCTP deaminase
VDPGWIGKLTLELSNQSQMPIALYSGMRIAQISFLTMTTPVNQPYGSPKLGSKYQGQTGPTPSRISREFP